MRIALTLSIALAAAGFAVTASAQTVYKLIDKNGKITYSEEKPKQFDGQVIRIDIDPNANTTSAPKRSAEESREVRMRERPDKKKAEPEPDIGLLQQRVDAARQALKDAQDHPGDSDVQYIGNKGGGTRAIPSEEYSAKITRLSDNVKRAEDALRNAGGSP
jgi:hypothetical protein